jgi:hypothetical protein
MFLPVLLVRDYGVWGFVVFAVPNVVGAGAMGWVLKRGASERIVAKHDAAQVWFMRITLAFQWFFVGWLGRAVGLWWIGLPLFLASLAIFRRPAASLTALAAWITSVACAVVFILNRPMVVIEGWSIWNTNPGVVWLAPVCCFGFALCPYLDMTFHKARQNLSKTSARVSFSLGFGMFFAAMIGFTLLYAPLILGWRPLNLSSIAGIAVLIHVLTQIAFTTGAFYDAFGHRTPARSENVGGWDLMVIILVAHIIGLFGDLHSLAGMSFGEVVYRCFMSFYGLVFPAYVWLCMIPTRDGHSGIAGPRGRLKLAVLAGACLLAAPCYWMGFIERVEWWLAPGLGVVLLARLLVRGHSSPTPASPQ